MDTKNFLLLTILTCFLLVLVMSFVNAAVSNGGVNISITSFTNGTLYATTNATTHYINFTINNGTTLAGANISFDIDGTHHVLCNTSAGATYPALLSPDMNASGCLDSGRTNSLYLNLSEGAHVIAINISFGDQLNSTSANISGLKGEAVNTTFYINNFESLNWVTGVYADGANISLSNSHYLNLSVNVTLLTSLTNLTFELWNSTTTLDSDSTYNSTNIYRMTKGGESVLHSANITWLNLPDDWYTFNVTLEDPHTGDNYSITRKFILDTIAPNKTSITCTGWYSQGDKTIEKGSTLTCTCSGVDENSTVVTYIYSPSSTPTTATSGSWLGVTCYARDPAGNNASSSSVLSYYVIDSVSTTGSGDSGGGSLTISGITHRVTEAQFEEGQTAQLSANDGFKVTFKPSSATVSETHTIIVSSITENSATIVISSDPITVTIDVEETKKVDVDGDGTYDISITLDSIVDGKASFTVIKTVGEVPEGEGPISGGPASGEESGAGTWWIWTIIAVIIIAVIIFFVMKKKK